VSSKKETQIEYLKKLNIVFDYIENNLDKKLTVKELAQISNLSEFHFHRIFKGVLGENIGNFITRKRVETSARLIRYTNLEIKEIAYNVGYESPASLSKIFKQYYGISPLEYRKDKDFFVVRPELKNPNIVLEKPIIKTIKDKKIIYIKITGKYGNENYSKVWKELWDFAKTNNLITDQTERIGISYDDPKITQSEKCKYDACLTVNEKIKPIGKIGSKTIKGGKYAVFTYKGDYKNLGIIYDKVFGNWLINSNYKMRNVPVFEIKENSISETDKNNFVTKIYLPIKS
jgi:AraC family transcriptional regulator